MIIRNVVVGLAVLVALAGCSSSVTVADSPSASSVASVSVPDVTGKTGDVAKAALKAAGLTVTWDAGSDTVILAGNWLVVSQSPAAGGSAVSGSAVTLKVEKVVASSTPVEATTKGLTETSALVACEDQGKSEFPYGFKMHSFTGLISSELNAAKTQWNIHVQVTVTNSSNAKRDAVMTCGVKGADDNPVAKILVL